MEYSCQGGLPFAPSVKGGSLFSFPMPKRLKRCYGQKDLHFLTFCCYRRRPYLQTAHAKNLFLQVLAQVRRQFQFSLVRYVLMPDHVHLLLSEPTQSTISKILQGLKQRVSRGMRGRKRRGSQRQLLLDFVDTLTADRRFWQRRFYDFNVWSHAKKKEKLHYMHANPVKERLVLHPKDWPWSSFSFYAYDAPGLIGIDPMD
jgi:REP-associated tyrosine transposase